jgi:phosphoketolase
MDYSMTREQNESIVALSAAERALIDAYWRAANYLSVGQIYLYDNPGSIHESGELGYAISHAFGAAFDNPDLIVACVVGDGEAETGPLATNWHSNKFLNPQRTARCCRFLHIEAVFHSSAVHRGG